MTPLWIFFLAVFYLSSIIVTAYVTWRVAARRIQREIEEVLDEFGYITNTDAYN